MTTGEMLGYFFLRFERKPTQWNLSTLNPFKQVSQDDPGG